MDEIKTKQQVIDKLKQAEKVLITVSKNPSVDALSAALGLTLLLDAQGKYATAIFSGETPPALAFLEPEKTFDDTTDSLRDFIIALNKEKADHLRYKVVDDAVKIFITPYKTTITEEDLEFSQGDYNVELVVAIGVDNQEDLDSALDNHGQILHDAAIVTVTSGSQTSTLGGIDWHDAGASSLSEMIAGLADGMKEKGDKNNKFLTEPVATSLLTGIVSETDRFSNERTTSRAMTISATLMAAGADQQLIANELQNAQNAEDTTPTVTPFMSPAEEVAVEQPASKKDSHGGLSIQHDPTDKPSKEAESEEAPEETLEELEARIRGTTKEEDTTQEIQPSVAAVSEEVEDAPQLGGVLNATTSMAETDARNAIESDQNKTILSHQYLQPEEAEVSSGDQAVTAVPEVEEVTNPEVSQLAESAYAIAGEKVIEPLSQVFPEAAPASAYVEPTAPAQDVSLPMPPPIPDFSQVGVAAPAIPLPPTEAPQILGDILNPPADESPKNAYGLASEAYAPEVPVTPVAPAPVAPEVSVQPVHPTSAYAADPGQFQIPPQ